MRRKKKEENDIALIPVEAFEETEDAEGAVPQDVEDNEDNIEETADTETLEQDTEAPEENTEAPEKDTEAPEQDTEVPEQRYGSTGTGTGERVFCAVWGICCRGK